MRGGFCFEWGVKEVGGALLRETFEKRIVIVLGCCRLYNVCLLVWAFRSSRIVSVVMTRDGIWIVESVEH